MMISPPNENPMSGSSRTTMARSLVRYGVLASVVLGLWAILAWWVAPTAIEIVYRGTGVQFVDGLLAGRGSVPLAEYQQEWIARRKGLTALVVTVTLLGVLAGALASATRLLPDVKPPRSERQPDPHPWRAGFLIILVSSVVALGTGYLEAYLVAGRVHYLGIVMPDVREISPDAVWMIPMVHGVIGALVGGLFAPTAFVSRGRVGAARAAGVTAFIGLLSTLMAMGWLQWWVAALLAAAIAVHLARLTFYLFPEAARLARRIGPILLAAPVLAALFLTASRAIRESNALEGRSTGTASTAPNVLLVVLDTETAANVGLYGYGRPTTPAFDSLARRGLVFDRAISPSTWTLPSHAGLFTGHLVSEYDYTRPPLRTERPMLAEVLRDQGYATAGFVGNIIFCNDFYGLDRGFTVWRDSPRSLSMALKSPWLTRAPLTWVRRQLGNHRYIVRKTAAEVNEEVLNWIPKVGGQPWFVFVNLFDAHDPYFPPPPFDTLFADAGAGRYWIGDGGAYAADYSARELTELRDRYDNGIAYTDRQLERLLTALEDRGELENTLVIVTSDHGELFGQSGFVGHGVGRHIDLIHVPLLIIPPGGLDHGERVSTPVTLREIPATVTAVTRPARPSPFPGRSLLRFLGVDDPAGTAADTVVSENSRTKFLVTEQYHYIYDPGKGVEELFNLIEDPRERQELSGTAEGRAAIIEFRQFLQAHDLYVPPSENADSGGLDLPWN